MPPGTQAQHSPQAHRSSSLGKPGISWLPSHKSGVPGLRPSSGGAGSSTLGLCRKLAVGVPVVALACSQLRETDGDTEVQRGAESTLRPPARPLHWLFQSCSGSALASLACSFTSLHQRPRWDETVSESTRPVPEAAVSPGPCPCQPGRALLGDQSGIHPVFAERLLGARLRARAWESAWNQTTRFLPPSCPCREAEGQNAGFLGFLTRWQLAFLTARDPWEAQWEMLWLYDLVPEVTRTLVYELQTPIRNGDITLL
ncbi:PREDICTED: uncharacterized protein LOC103591143 [Galeopterus variegatus]|uniref:Uncharacterized protein LOC103591143 n=1 Tax=Galeopterus variegatus TaxID=482537 RepID=A0ABM0QTT5_GALVR|nr:PREDICTED: uncharacterized protein LOC103591143 [Galeopterus variegatus]